MPELSIGRAVTWLAERDPEAVAVRCDDVTLTRAALDRWSNAVARVLGASGVRRDDRVALDLPDPVAFVVACAAVWKAGATPAPLAPGLTRAERAAVLGLLAPRLLLADLPAVTDVDDAPVPDHAASSWKAALSSGSTGRPKVVLAAAPARIDPERPVAPFVPVDAVQLVAAPLAHGAPFVYAMRGLTCGHELVTMRDFDPDDWLALVARRRVTWGLLSPASMLRIWRSPGRPDADVGSLDAVLHLGARCPPWLKRAWLGWLGPDRVDEVYAGTESQGIFRATGPEWLSHPGTVGRPVSGTQVRIVRPDGTDAGPGEPGEVLMRRPDPTYSYLGADPVVRDGWHTLGDAGHLDADGYLHLGDRLADLVHLGDRTVSPADVEATLESHPEVGSAVVVAAAGGTGLHAVVQTTLADADLDRWAVAHLDAALRPRTWERVAVPLRDAAGKVRRARHRPAAGDG